MRNKSILEKPVSSSGSGHTIQEEGSPLTARTNLNFVGANVTVTDGGAVTDDTIITVGGVTQEEVIMWAIVFGG